MRSWLVVLGVLLFVSPALADLGPKPSAVVHVVFEGQAIAEPIDARLLSCFPTDTMGTEAMPAAETRGGTETIAQDAILDWDPDMPAYFRIKEFDAARKCNWLPPPMTWTRCEGNTCRFNYYVPQEFKVAALLSGKQKVYVSEPVTRQAFNAEFVMNIPENGMASLTETTPLLQQVNVLAFLASLLITLAMELGGTLFFFWRFGMPFNKKLLALVGAANLISLPMVWLVFPRFGPDPIANLLLSEAFAVLFEAGFLFYLARPLLTGKRALALSLLNNALSLFVGGLLFILLASALNLPIY